MSTRTRRIGAVVGGAAVLSFGAYAIGSQAGDGVAVSKSGSSSSQTTAPRGPLGPGARGLDNLAGRLGVTAADLEAALEDIRKDREPPAGNRRDRLAAGLAGKLGVDESKVAEALDKLRPERPSTKRRGERRPPRPGRPPGPSAAALAKELGADEAQVKTALRELRAEQEAEHEKRRNEFAQALADRLGIDVEKVKDALPVGPPHHGGRGRP